MSTLDAIRDALAGIDERVYYGTASGLEPGAPWDYTVFSRDSIARSDGRTGETCRYIVAVVREEYIPEGMYGKVVDAMESIPGMRLSKQDAVYTYDVKPGTKQTVEMMVVRFAKAVKR